MKHLERLKNLARTLGIGTMLLILPGLTWAGHARISCTSPPARDIGRNWSDTSSVIPVSLPSIMNVSDIISIDPGQSVQCMVIASNNIQGLDNHGTTQPAIATSLLIPWASNQNIIFTQSKFINPQVIVYSASSGTQFSKLQFMANQPGVISAGDTLFSVTYNSKVRLANTGDSGFNVVIPFVATNRTVIVSPACDFTSQNVTVNLPEYSVAGTAATSVPVSVSCTSSFSIPVRYSLTGSTASGDDTIFSSDGTAKGVGVRFFHNSQPLSANQIVQFGNIGGNATDLGLSVAYARTGTRLTAGTVQSRVNLNISYF